ncbi:MAG: dihydroorotase [Patescibacteria group bacterium]|nr:dihydroorotase [Patescibacteria group bacterium]
MDTLTIVKPDDWHAHLRDGAMLEAVLPFIAERFGRAIVMPNLSPDPVVTTEDLRAYRARIEATLGKNPHGFTPLMTYYLTETSSPEMIAKGFTDGEVHAVKAYPANATTNSAQGVTDIKNVYPVLEAMQKVGMPILLHGETVMRGGEEIPHPDREKVFLDTTLPMLLKDFPELKIVLEHATTKDAVDFVMGEDSPRLGSTLTAHHLLASTADVAASEHPAYLKCMPVIKSETDKASLRKAATSGNEHFFLGTDSAPHPVSAKERANPAAGVYTGVGAMELYAQVFDEEGKLENFEAFASLNGPRFYGLEPNAETVTLMREPWTIDDVVHVSNGDTVRPFGYDEDPAKRLTLNWKLA